MRFTTFYSKHFRYDKYLPKRKKNVMDRKVSAVKGCTPCTGGGGGGSPTRRGSLPHHRVWSRSDPHPASYPTHNGRVLPMVRRPEPQTSAEIQNPWNISTRTTLPLTLIKKNNSLKVLSDLPKSGWLRVRQPALI